jgi:hypothetical protein
MGIISFSRTALPREVCWFLFFVCLFVCWLVGWFICHFIKIYAFPKTVPTWTCDRLINTLIPNSVHVCSPSYLGLFCITFPRRHGLQNLLPFRRTYPDFFPPEENKRKTQHKKDFTTMTLNRQRRTENRVCRCFLFLQTRTNILFWQPLSSNWACKTVLWK